MHVDRSYLSCACDFVDGIDEKATAIGQIYISRKVLI